MATVDKVITAPYFFGRIKKQPLSYWSFVASTRKNEPQFIFLDHFDGAGIAYRSVILENKGTLDD
jgi:hypothetical protein